MSPAVLNDRDVYFDLDRIRALDPLKADSLCYDIRAMNARADTTAIVAALREILPGLETLPGYTPAECVAAMRDIGIFLGSVKRHGAEPADAVPEVVPVLLELGRRTDMVPRDTVHHYTSWNPAGIRQRMYTGDVQERFLQDSARLSLVHLTEIFRLCDQLSGLDACDQGLAIHLDTITGHLRRVVDSIDITTREVAPIFFARSLRPFYEDILVDGISYHGPAGGQVPLWLVDVPLWASDRATPAYAEFLRVSAPYCARPWRTHYAEWVSAPSLITRFVAALPAGEPSPALAANVQALTRVLREVVVFRARHLGIARKAYHEEVGLYSRGSGGGTIGLLHEILDLTRQNAHLVRGSCRVSGKSA
jgi:monodechloroaminopyrrolnitrin synthase